MVLIGGIVITKRIYYNLLKALIILSSFAFVLCQGQDSYQITGNAEIATQNETNVTITKTVDGSTLKYIIKTPKVDDFEFVLALDSSGSFGFGGDESESGKKAVMNAVPRFLTYAKNNYTDEKFNFKVAVIGWNNKVDFAYGDIENKNPTKASLVPVEKATNDIDALLKSNYNPTEDKYTDFSTAVRASLDLFDSHPPTEYNRTSRFIILLTGASEFTRCSPELLARLNSSKIKIYVVAIKVPDNPKSMMYEHLTKLSASDRVNLIKDPNQELLRQSLNDLLYEALRETLDKAANENPADNVKFVESLYSYLDPRSVTVNGKPTTFKKINNTDKTSTVTFTIKEGLPADALTEVAIDCDLDLKNLPVSVTKDRRPVTLCTPATSTPSSEISYDWLQIKGTIHKELPENHMDVNNRFTNRAKNQDEDQVASPIRPPVTTLLLRILDTIGL